MVLWAVSYLKVLIVMAFISPGSLTYSDLVLRQANPDGPGGEINKIN